jgi:uncharacterized protein YllA (UPF0747 family)
MSIQDSTGVETSGTTDSTDAPAAAVLPTTFGVDGAGAAHHHDEWNDRVAVIEADGEVHHHDLDGRDLEEWIAYVASERGWTDEWLDQSITRAEHDRRLAAARTEATCGAADLLVDAEERESREEWEVER